MASLWKSSFLYDEGPSDWRTAVSRFVQVLVILSGLVGVWNEALGKKPAPYSKFAEVSRIKGKTVPSRVGMLLLYTPAGSVTLLVIAWKIIVGQSTGAYPSTRFWLVAGAFALHFHKRMLEALFVHRYSGVMELETVITILFLYVVLTLNGLFSQHIVDALPRPAVDTTRAGVVVYFVGMAGNFYHHLLLRNLRRDDSKKYVTPQGGLFCVFVAPHYILEIIEYVGLALISQTVSSVGQATFVLLYLGSRSYGTKLWYRKKIDGFPLNRCALIPGVF